MADILIGTATTNENGLAAFTGLPPGTYKYVQTTATTGYTLDPAEYTIVIADATPVTADRTNAPTATGSITITKHVQGFPDFVLTGATFTLADSTGKTMLTESAATGADGTLVLNNLMSIDGTPQSYKVTEVTAPSGYQPNATEFDVSVTVGQASAQPVPNTPSVQGSLDIDLTDVNYTEYGLQNADYSLYVVTP